MDPNTCLAKKYTVWPLLPDQLNRSLCTYQQGSNGRYYLHINGCRVVIKRYFNSILGRQIAKERRQRPQALQGPADLPMDFQQVDSSSVTKIANSIWAFLNPPYAHGHAAVRIFWCDTWSVYIIFHPALRNLLSGFSSESIATTLSGAPVPSFDPARFEWKLNKHFPAGGSSLVPDFTLEKLYLDGHPVINSINRNVTPLDLEKGLPNRQTSAYEHLLKSEPLYVSGGTPDFLSKGVMQHKKYTLVPKTSANDQRFYEMCLRTRAAAPHKIRKDTKSTRLSETSSQAADKWMRDFNADRA